tara:strand:+ start:156 stop:446 length:291 start_codon:yes stop_codon:yes gene_type:complete
MKKIKNLGVYILLTVCMSSCYVSTYVVGNGGTSATEERIKNQYWLGGLVTGKQADTKNMANGKTDYTIQSKFTFADMLLNGITWGIYSPRTVIVKH